MSDVKRDDGILGIRAEQMAVAYVLHNDRERSLTVKQFHEEVAKLQGK